MHAVIVNVSIDDREEAARELREDVIPRVSQAPGFVSGVWVAVAEGKGQAVISFESEEAARAVADIVRNADRSAVTIDDIQVCEVVASA